MTIGHLETENKLLKNNTKKQQQTQTRNMSGL